MGKIRAIVKRADEQFGHVTWISNTLKNLQTKVGGYIECEQAAGGNVIGKEKSAKHRSKTFEGIAEAMSEQWGEGDAE